MRAETGLQSIFGPQSGRAAFIFDDHLHAQRLSKPSICEIKFIAKKTAPQIARVQHQV